MGTSTLADEIQEPLGRREVAAGYAWNASFSIVAKLFFPLLTVFFYRRLGPEQIGIYSVLIPIYMICESLRDAGLALTYVADRKGKEREGQYASLALLNAGLFGAAIFFSRAALARLFSLPELVWGLEMVALAIVLTGLSTIPANKLQRRARFRDAAMVDFLSTLLSYAAAFALVLLGLGYKALIWQFVLRSVFYTVGCWVTEPVRLAWIKVEVVAAVWKHATHNLLNNLLFTVYTVADNLAVSKLFGVTALGYYNAAYTFGMKPVEFFTSPLARTLLIAYSRKNDDKEALTNVFTRTIALSILLMVPLYALVGAFATPLSTWLLTKKFQDAGPLLAILVFYCGFRSVGLLCGNVLVAMNKPVYNVYGWVVGYVVAIGLVLVNLHHLSLAVFVMTLTCGAAASYAFTGLAAFAILTPRGENARKLWRASLLSALSVAIALGLAHSGLPAKQGFLIGLFALPCVQLIGAGLVYGGSASACLSRGGLKRVYRAI